MIQLEQAFKLLNNDEDYIFIDGHLIDTRRPKYQNYKQWYKYNKLHCFSCLKKATHFKLLKTKGDGSIYKKTGEIKYTLNLYSDDNTLFTFDHWYPMWFLKQHNLKNTMNNKVPMCQNCNTEKAGKLPLAGLFNKTFYLPKLEKMSRIIITGDVHGNFKRLNMLINKNKPELIICCGDFGYWPNSGRDLTDIKLQGAEKLLWCEGNHEDHWSLANRESDEIVPGIIYMPRGSTYELPDGRTILFMGGADSIDKRARTLGRDWFPEEIITQKDMMNLPDIKVDIFITHTCPNELIDTLKLQYPEKGHEPSNDALTELWKIYKPDLWYFGHWHQYQEGVLNGITKWHCLSYPGQGQRWWMWLPN